eukprot:CAMPEP_0171306336 /NCGR_PEP_ID=MMETSP0816-20121228/16333_1 /TAXON_ID=420281 /ORGANISM="Proboscia inermis, Strain CCAP1064/1" /LENGTH=34 /DNA_ID= /DNA_START= /DNA_END= /DNA_ORIENTATION=
MSGVFGSSALYWDKEALETCDLHAQRAGSKKCSP